MKTIRYYVIGSVTLFFLLASCDLGQLGEDILNKGKEFTEAMEEKAQDIHLNGFSIEDDKQMGKELYNEMVNSGKHKVLNPATNKEIYAYVEKIKQTILNSGQVENKNAFEWKVTIMDDDTTINAFCAPGGYIFVYTGILKYLRNEAELAGVMAHEIAHADLRHGTRQLTKQIGIEIILGYLLDGQFGSDIAAGLLSLRYSRMYERQADKYSVKYLCPTSYDAAGGAGFFEKIKNEAGKGDDLDLFSTHPDSGERIGNYKSEKQQCQCKGRNTFASEYKKKVATIKN
jgi:predicted Zn-dependent protease